MDYSSYRFLAGSMQPGKELFFIPFFFFRIKEKYDTLQIGER